MGVISRLARRLLGAWRLEGYDAFAGTHYPLPGRYRSEAAAQRAARRRLRHLDRVQPTDVSGGQEGIQDQVEIIRPDGSRYRFRA